jgi:lysophospholipase L1-like esterase
MAVGRRDLAINAALVVLGVGVAVVVWVTLLDGGGEVRSAYEGIYRTSDDPILRVELVPGGPINRDGFFGRDYAVDKPAGTFRIVGIGDSVTMYHSAEGLSFLSLLERSLPRVAERPVEVLNLAVASYDTPEEVRSLVVRGLKYDPDLVLVGYCVNDGVDFVALARSLAGEEALGDRPADDDLETHRLVREAAHADAAIGWSGLFEDHVARQDKWSASLAALDELHTLSNAEAFGVLVVIFPALLALDDYYLAPVHAAVAEHARALGFGVLDLAPRFREAGNVERLRSSPRDALHLSAEGHRVAARAIERWLAVERPWVRAAEGGER